MTSKQDKIFSVASTIFSLESQKGHLQWKVTELERKSKVKRALIYRYFGNSKKEIFKQALKIFLEQFYGLNRTNTKAVPFPERIKLARRIIQKHPEAVSFYQKWRTTDSDLNNIFVETENKFQKKLKKIFPHLSEKEVLTAHICIHGLVTAPFLNPDQAASACEMLIKKGVF
jgi:AcrR family transcriptional regulator